MPKGKFIEDPDMPNGVTAWMQKKFAVNFGKKLVRTPQTDCASPGKTGSQISPEQPISANACFQVVTQSESGWIKSTSETTSNQIDAGMFSIK